jgi:hypothetical protein
MEKLDVCKAFKNKIERLQCPNKIKTGIFCGKHRNSTTLYFDDLGCLLNQTNNTSRLIEKLQVTQQYETETYRSPVTESIIISRSGRTNVYKNLEHNEIYTNYLLARKNYIKEPTKHIELVEYIENSKMDLYAYPRILASLEYYKLINKSDNSKFRLIINNITILESFFKTLLRINLNMDKIIKLQRWIKTKLSIYSNRLHGPAMLDRTLCVNDTDFVTLDNLIEIPDEYFISFNDKKNFIYGFSLDSSIDLLFKSDENYYENFLKQTQNTITYHQYIKTLYNHYNKIKINNPYTRFLIDGRTKYRIIKLYARKMFKNGTIKPSVEEIVDIKTAVRNKCFAVFQKIDMFGYFTNTCWLMDENVKVIKHFYKKLAMLWNFEFGLNNTARYNISRTHNLFDNLHDIVVSRADKYHLLDKILTTLNILVTNGNTESDRNSGAIMILYALSEITPQCVQANPWLA